MELTTAERTVEVHGATNDTHRAQIASNPQMFKILYDKIYTMKELAVVRELLCNAWDAHVDAGTTDTPIDIHLPTYLEPWFQIDDYGTGLSVEQVKDLYMNYGNSNKRETNEQMGAFGLGSKAPFAFTDQFTVTSRFDGTASTFQAYLGSDGAPMCSLIRQDATDRPNGLTVYVPVPESWSVTNRFTEALQTIAPYVPTTPRVLGGSIDLDRSEPEMETEANGYRLVRRRSPDFLPCLVVVMGIVPYEMDLRTLQDSTFVHDGTLKQRQFRKLLSTFNRTIELHAPIGSFEITVSREQIAQDTDTVAKVGAVIKELLEKLIDEKREEIDRADTTFIKWINGVDILGFCPAPDQFTHQHWWMDVDNTLGVIAPKDDYERTAAEVSRETPIIRMDELLHAIDGECRRVLSQDRNLQKGFRTYKISRFSVEDLEHGLHIVASSKDYPFAEYARKYFSQPGAQGKILVLKGEPEQIRNHIKTTLGMDLTIHELPNLRSAPSPTKQARIKGATKYSVVTVNGLKNRDCTRHLGQVTAQDCLETLKRQDPAQNNVLLIVQPNAAKVGPNILAELVNNGWVHNPHGIETVVQIRTNENHVRVRKELTECAEGLGCRVFNSDSDYEMTDLFPLDEVKVWRHAYLYDMAERMRSATTADFEKRLQRLGTVVQNLEKCIDSEDFERCLTAIRRLYCRRSHDIGTNVRRVLGAYGLDVEDYLDCSSEAVEQRNAIAEQRIGKAINEMDRLQTRCPVLQDHLALRMLSNVSPETAKYLRELVNQTKEETA